MDASRSDILRPLEYAPQFMVGDLTLSRADGLVTIKVKAGWRRILRVLSPVWVLGIFAAMFLSVYFVSPRSRVSSAIALSITLAIVLLSTLAIQLKALIFTLHGHTWIANFQGLEFIGRQMTSILRHKYPRAMIADLRVDRVKVQNKLFKVRGLVLVTPIGGKHMLLYGTRAELNFACEAFREALRLPPDPMGESKYAVPPFWSRIRRRVLLNGVVLTLNPPRIGLDGWLIVAFTAVWVAVLDLVVAPANPGLILPDTFSALGMALFIVFTIVAASLSLSVKYRLRRAVTISWTAAGIHLAERSLFTPCSVSWPAAQVRSVKVEPDGATKRADLILTLQDGTVVPLIKSQPRSEVQLAMSLIHTAVELSKAGR